MALLLTLFCGFFFLIGMLIYKLIDNKNSLSLMAVSIASVVILGLISFDLIPELIEIGSVWNILFVLIGFGILIVIDKFVPHHHHDHHENDEETLEHQEHLVHISVVTIIALLLHNLIEGMALYSVATNSLKSGLLMMVGIGLHNLPFGFSIASFNKNNKAKILIFLLVISGFIGGLFISIFGTISEFFEGAIIAITLGMLLNILINELFGEVKQNIKKKEIVYGIIIGSILIVLISLF